MTLSITARVSDHRKFICSGLSGTWCAYFMILPSLLIHMLRVKLTDTAIPVIRREPNIIRSSLVMGLNSQPMTSYGKGGTTPHSGVWMCQRLFRLELIATVEPQYNGTHLAGHLRPGGSKKIMQRPNPRLYAGADLYREA